MGVLNVAGDLRTRLAKAMPDATVRVTRRKGDKAPLVTITREGGRRLDALRDRAGVGIYCYGKSEDEACGLASDVSDAMLRLSFADGYDLVEQDFMGSDPDPDSTDHARWYLQYTITTHVPA